MSTQRAASIHAPPASLPSPLSALLLSACLLSACDKVPAKQEASTDAAAQAEAGENPPAAEAGEAAATGAEASAGEPAEPGASTPGFAKLLAWLSPDALAVTYDGLDERFDAATLSVVFAIPPKAADLLEERQTLDEALDIVFDGDTESDSWIGVSSLAFTVALSKTPYIVRPLTRPAAEVEAFFEIAGFTHNEVEGYEVWLPSGSFPWRISLLEDDLVAFIPVDVPGAGLEPLTSAKEKEASVIEKELERAMTEDPTLALMLVSTGPLVHYDVSQTIGQTLFAMRKVPLGASHGYEGQVQLMPTQDPDACAEDLRKRSHPEENAQVQALMAEVAFVVDQGAVSGNLGITPDKLKHLLLR